MTLTKKIALAFGLLLIGGVFGWKIVYVPTGETHNIVLTEDGFEPKKVSIQAGDVIRFTTTRNEPFWPASNSHPIHDIYSAFDPRKPIAPNDSWEFKFKKVGAWEYHDHLFPYYRGTIVVAKAGSVSLDPSTFRNQIASLISQKGGERAFLELKSAVGGEEIPQQHLLAHIFGEELFEKEGVEGIGVCDETFTFGCYHGFFTAAVGQEGAGIVSELDKKCIELFGEMGLGCPHGIGHGLGEYYGGGRLSEQLAVCDTLTWQGRLFGCRGGVFMEHNFPTVVGAEDAEATVRALEGTNYFSPCNSVPQNAKSACYFELSSWWNTVLKQDYSKMGELCGSVLQGQLRKDCFFGLGNMIAETSSYNLVHSQKTCNSLPGVSPSSLCLAGVSWAFFANPKVRDKTEEVCLVSKDIDTCQKEAISLRVPMP